MYIREEDNEDFSNLIALGLLMKEVRKDFKPEDFVINPPQVEKFIQVCDFFKSLQDDWKSDVDITFPSPCDECGDINIYCYVLDLHGDSLKRFTQILKYISAISIDALNNGKICISVTVPGIYIRKDII